MEPCCRTRWLKIFVGLVLSLGFGQTRLQADPPVASYLFPAGGRRGTTVQFRVGGLFLHPRCAFEMMGPGVTAPREIVRTPTTWFEGPLLPLPDSQQAEDYPKDLAGKLTLAGDAPLGVRYWRVATSQGATAAQKFMVGDLPEIVETETEGPRPPTEVSLPVTINGRIFPREDVDAWSFRVQKGQCITAEVCAARLGSPLDSRLEVLDPEGKRIAESDDALGRDSRLHFTAATDGKYTIRILDTGFRGGQAYVYRLTLTAGPWVEGVFPLGGRGGQPTRFELSGQALPERFATIVLPHSVVGESVQRLAWNGQKTNPFLLDVGHLPEYQEREPNDAPAQALAVAAPAVFNGRIEHAADIDYWSIRLAQGKTYELQLKASQLGSPLNAALTLQDASGKELMHADSLASGADPALRFTAPATGAFLVRVKDCFRNRGGPAFAYRLVVDEAPAPDYRLHLATDALIVNRGGQASLRLNAVRLGGFSGEIELSVTGLPAGVTVGKMAIPANQPGVDLIFQADARAPIRTSHVVITGRAAPGMRKATLPPEPGVLPLDHVLLAVALPTPFKVVGEFDMRWAARGTVHQRHYKIERGGFTGPLEISLADHQMRHLQGVTGPTIIVPAGTTEFDYAITLPPWMETGRTCRACVMAVGKIKDFDGTEHLVSYHSVNQNEQIVAVVEPGKLDVSAERHSLIVEPGSASSIEVAVARGKDLRGAVRLELIVPAQVQGISAEPVMIPPDQSKGQMVIRCVGLAKGLTGRPLVIRASMLERGRPVVAETHLELLPKP